MKKKIVFLGAALTALATLSSCSNEEELTQVVEPAVKGTPFSISAFNDDTRAVRYGSGGTEVGGDGYVNCFKLYGAQGANVWIEDLVFTRASASGSWAPKYDNTGAAFSETLYWPTENKTTATTFYALTDNAITTGTANNPIAFMSGNLSAGNFTYTLPYASKDNVAWVGQSDVAATVTVNYVDDTKLVDLMGATNEMTEPEGGALKLSFKHLLSGLTIKAKFVEPTGVDPANSWASLGEVVRIKAIRVYGLYTSGKYTFGDGGGAWSNLSGEDGYQYYKEFDTPVELTCETSETVVKTLVDAGEWLVIPQSVQPWDNTVDKVNLPPVRNGKPQVYIAIKYDDLYGGVEELAKTYVHYMALDLNGDLTDGVLERAKNHTFTINMLNVRKMWSDDTDENSNNNEDGKGDYYFTLSGGSGRE